MMNIPLSSPDITELERGLVLDVLNTTTLSMGPYVAEFEKLIRDHAGTKHAVAVNSGTSGLHLIVRALGIGDEDEVITTPFSFVASSNCLLFERAKPVFVDIEEETLNIDPAKIEGAITERTRGLLPVHVFGHPCQMDELNGLCEQYGLAMIEDSCESIGSTYKGKRTGSFGRAGVYAFYPNKQITTGEGGIIVTDDDDMAQAMISMRNQGRGESNAWLTHERLGFNYRMSELQAALGVAQMRRLEEIEAKRKRAFALYDQAFQGVAGVQVPQVVGDVGVNWFVYVIRFDEGIDRDRVMHQLLEKGIGCRPYFSPIHLQPYYRETFGYREGDFPVTERVARSTLAIPFFGELSAAQVDEVVSTIQSILRGR